MPFSEARAIPRTIGSFQNVLLSCYHIAVFQLWAIAFMFTLGPAGWSAFPFAVKIAYLVPYVVTGIFGWGGPAYITVMPQYNIGLSDPIRTPTECVIRLLLLRAYWTLVHLLWAAAFFLTFVADDNGIWPEQRHWAVICLIIVVRTAFLVPMVITGCSGGWGWPNKQNMRDELLRYAPPIAAVAESPTEFETIGVTENTSVRSPDEPDLFTDLPSGPDSEPAQENMKLGEAFDVLVEKGGRENLCNDCEDYVPDEEPATLAWFLLMRASKDMAEPEQT
ncbi:hypothetical protein YB2330_003767 [Saitoella coloradoensis]